MSNDSGSSVVMFVFGIAVGAIATALYTPVTGPALRRRLGKAAEEGAEMANDALVQADEFVQEQTKAAKTLVNRAGDVLQKTRDAVTDAAG